MPEGNEHKIILDLCGATGAWSQPYREAGYDVRVITFPEHDVRTYEPPPNVYGILAAPPCTEFSRAKTTAPRDFAAGLQTVSACLQIIWQAQMRSKLAFWALENPMGLLRRFLGNPPLSFEPWWYGDFHTKRTDLWGKYNTPRRIVCTRPMLVPWTTHNENSDRFANPKPPHQYRHLKLDRAAIRAITPAGFARAFFKANP